MPCSSCRDGADLFARRVLAVHARERLHRKARWIVDALAAEVAVDANPVHFAAARDHRLADDWNVVFRLARDDARAATRAGREIDRHRPAVLRAVEIRLFPERKTVRDVTDVTREIRMRLVVREARLTNKARKTRLDAVGWDVCNQRVSCAVILRMSECVRGAGLRDRSLRTAERGRRAQRIRVETRAICDASACFATTVTKRDRCAVVRVTRKRPHGGFHRCRTNRHLRHVALLEAERARGCRRHEQCVVPRDLRRNVGDLLQPAEVCEATIADLRIEGEREFHLGARVGGRGGAHRAERVAIDLRSCGRLPRGRLNVAAIEILAPPRLERRTRKAADLHVCATHDFVA
jgi:hypothetical protein